MFTLFGRKPKPSLREKAAATEASKGLIRPESATQLMDTPRRRMLLEHIWQRTSLSRRQFDSMYRAPIERYALLVQQFPASESHHHAYAGGMLDHGLEIVAFVLKLRQSHLLPVGAPSESQAAQAEAWSAAAAYAALLHDIGKIAVDLYVEYEDGTRWHPWHGALDRPYRFRYRRDREYRLHGAAAGLLYTRVLDSSILDWLNGFPELWSTLLYVLAGQNEHAGLLGELVTRADQASVAQDLGGDPSSARAAPRHALQRKLLDGLRLILKEELKLNQPQASDGWLTHEALWLVSKTVCDKLRAHLLSHGISGIPERNTAVFNVLQEHGIVQPNADGNAIWKAKVTSDAGWSHSFTFLKLAPALIWDSDDRPPSFAGTVQPEITVTATATNVAAESGPTPRPPSADTAASRTTERTAPVPRSDDSVASLLELFGDADLLQSNVVEATDNAPEAAPPNPLSESSATHITEQTQVKTSAEPPGQQFIAWLRESILSRKLVINDAKALVHLVAGTAYLVSPGIFRRYTQEHPNIAHQARHEKISDWEWVQKNFERLKLHKKQSNGLNIWTCEVTGPRRTRRVHGYLLNDGTTLFADLPFDNPYLKLMTPDTPARDPT